MPKESGNLISVKIVRYVERNLRPGMVVWLADDLADRLIDDGSAIAYYPTIYDVEVRS